jgi:hypothetical protein
MLNEPIHTQHHEGDQQKNDDSHDALREEATRSPNPFPVRQVLATGTVGLVVRPQFGFGE